MLKRWIAVQSRIEEIILAAAILLMAAMMVANVATRSLFGFSIAANEELAQFLIILVCFVGTSYAAAKRRHIRMTAFFEQLPPQPRRLLSAAVAAGTGALMFWLTVIAIRYVILVADLGSVSPVLGVPLYLVYAVAPLGLALAGLHSMQEAWAWLRGEEQLPSDVDLSPEASLGHAAAEREEDP